MLHAGFYYSPDSLKARLTRLGNRKLTEYCESRRIPLNRCGKLVVAADRSGHDQLRVLLDRAKTKGLPDIRQGRGGCSSANLPIPNFRRIDHACNFRQAHRRQRRMGRWRRQGGLP